MMTLVLIARATFAAKTAPPKAEDSPPAVTIEVFADFQCPYCAQFAQPVRELESKGVDGVKTAVTFKNFPLNFHADAQLAAQAAMAAAEQEKFWEMHDLLYGNQASIKRDDLIRYAEKLGLDMDRFRKDLDSDRVKQTIQADLAEGIKRGVQGTPTFFINGKSYSGTKPYEQLKQLILAENRTLQAISDLPESLMSKGARQTLL